ncbi:uncharacterized protein LOC115665335 [Syzygium oleosum]|uniref:uncharacterized protein LOC115665335 n=1 Tax=Syzygium oleosum TaxID=219896 RepID=UPI0011D195D7|nr:uncharacterized protein LOC115665335 [Syzygium oleosum]
MSTSLPLSVTSSSALSGLLNSCPRPSNRHSISRPTLASLHRNSFKLKPTGEKLSFFEVGRVQNGVLVKEGEKLKRSTRVVVVRFNRGFGFNGGGGGGGRDDGATGRVVGNLVLAIGLAYLSMTGQLGWVLDAIVSIWLLVVLIPIVGLGAFLWWAGRDIVQSSCPNCGNDFQIFKSTLNDELQLCPFCSQPFSVVDNKFVRESVTFSNQFSSKGEAASEFYPRPKKGKNTPTAVVDVEAEVKDAD